jgi:hypothetical protein
MLVLKQMRNRSFTNDSPPYTVLRNTIIVLLLLKLWVEICDRLASRDVGLEDESTGRCVDQESDPLFV